MKFRRLMAAFISMAMVVGSLPAFVYAEENEIEKNEFGVGVTEDSRGSYSANNDEPDVTVKIDIPDQTVSDPDPSDNDELFKGYIEKKLNKAPVRLRKISLGSRLTGATKSIYSGLVPEIQKIAEGTRTSTEFTFDVKEIGLGDYYTAEQLGVQSIVENGGFSDAAYNAMSGKLDIDTRALIQALLQDCTYEMYWYDKTVGMKTASSLSIGAVHNGTEYCAYFTGTITFKFTVAQGYASGTYSTDTSKIDRVNTAIANAAAIVNSAKNKSDLEKLVFYRTEICDRVEYDHAAADNSSTPYGDPWQMISVFDNDTGTNVVCEGYAKAFKYLCDLTTFANKEISCITVSGVMSGATGSGGHMWNIVKMDDGKYYLVDVTNCDSDSVGNPDLLFLKGFYSGNVSDGYKFKCRSSYVTYTYKENTLNSFSEELAISNTDYKDCIASGTFGNDITWVLGNDGVLTFTGSGEMKNVGLYDIPWRSYKDSIKSVVFNGNITSIGGYVFADWTQLTSFVIPDGVTKIGMGAFSGCSNLKNITIPDSVTFIAGSAFKNCTSLVTVDYGSDKADWESINIQELNNALFNAKINYAYYSVKVNSNAGGTATADKTKVKPGETVTITIKNDTGYELDYVKLNNTDLSGKTFTMPSEDVTIDVVFKKTGYTVTVTTVGNGTASADKEKAGVGDTVTINISAGECYELDTIKLDGTAISGNTFTMPAKDVKVEVTFKAKSHELSHVAGKAATCTEDGHEAYYECDRCHKIFSDADGKKEISAPAVITKLGHDLKAYAAKAPTKTEPGNIAYYECQRCYRFFSDKDCKHEITKADIVIPAMGHDLTKVAAKAATCTEDGNIEYYICKDTDCGCGKVYSDAYGQNEISKASTVIHATGHDIVPVAAKEPTCDTDGYESHFKCRKCSKLFSDSNGTNEITAATVKPKLGHAWDEGEVTTEPGCETEGVKTFHCTREGCKKTKTEKIDPLGHDPEHYDAKEPTAKEGGWKEHYRCKRCGKRFADEACTKYLQDSEVLLPKLGSPLLNEEYEAGSFNYRVTNPADNGTGAVSFIGVKNPTEAVVIPGSVVIKGITYKVNRIASTAFFNDTTVKTVYIGANILIIDNNAFFGCSNLVKVSGGARVKTIGTNAFARCPKLSTFVITSTALYKIGPQAFYKDSRLKTIYIKNTAKLTKGGVKKSLKGSSVKTVKVKKSKVSKYKKYFKKSNSGRKVKVKK
ncbi:MAG: leucine-rich repeat protein [Saccharofermentans sp.]|nr:leucine-rich repeat protein [Saccharofermentans sp.]